MTTKHSAIYVRVSSKQQDHASQMPDLERWVAAQGGAVVWFRDKFTGRSMDRPGMDKLLGELRAGKVERIVVWRLDRLGRTTKGLCQLFDELGERKVDLVSLKDGFSLASPAGRLHARILASVAEYETEVRAERVAAGQAVARKKGKKWGGSKKGWRWKVTDDQLAAIHEMRAAGRPVAQIARVRHQAITWLTRHNGMADAELQLITGHSRRETLAIYQHIALDGDLERKYQAAMKEVDL
ncbi:MAG: recombinase family protein [Planctomycetota bacterium]|nr:recombinase family protein [Planctomycetota bacterium]